ncbi:MAG: 3-oxoacyl-[acyl-carrier-protein] reductase [Candidatus Cloacimonetes bacterium]|nr:3-oxoacyl-[acyl-carrier-protein] reductase [Candidatus Cloacimonadota bacterium]
MKFDFSGKNVVVTGSARGIGFAIAGAYAACQATTFVLDLNQEQVNQAVEKLCNQGYKAFGYVANVTDPSSLESTFKDIIEKHQSIDVLINNAGITKDNLLLRMKSEEWQSVLSVNLNGTHFCTQQVCKYMLKQRSGVILNIASVIGMMGNAGQANYAASKGGIIAYTKACAKEFASRGIRVNAIAPGFIETEMTSRLPQEVVDNYAKAIPLARMGKPIDIANLCLFLTDEISSYITGQTIAVDGGLTMY